MPDNNEAKPISISLPGAPLKDGTKPPPHLLQTGTRAAGAGPDPFIGEQVAKVDAVYDRCAAARGAPTERTKTPPAAHALLALEAVQDETALDLSAVRDREGASRGLADWVWSRLTELILGPDAIIGAATNKAREWVLEKLGEAAVCVAGEDARFGSESLTGGR